MSTVGKITWTTRNDLPDRVRGAAIGLLNQQLADALDLGLQLKQAHWNVKGRHFAALHGLFEDAGTEFAEFADDLAERAVALGGTAEGTLRTVARNTRLAPYPSEALAGEEHIVALAGALAQFVQSARRAIVAADEAGDADTADLFTSISRAADKLLWKIEAHDWNAK